MRIFQGEAASGVRKMRDDSVGVFLFSFQRQKRLHKLLK